MIRGRISRLYQQLSHIRTPESCKAQASDSIKEASAVLVLSEHEHYALMARLSRDAQRIFILAPHVM
jgi:hypothetical protein